MATESFLPLRSDDQEHNKALLTTYANPLFNASHGDEEMAVSDLKGLENKVSLKRKRIWMMIGLACVISIIAVSVIGYVLYHLPNGQISHDSAVTPHNPDVYPPSLEQPSPTQSTYLFSHEWTDATVDSTQRITEDLTYNASTKDVDKLTSNGYSTHPTSKPALGIMTQKEGEKREGSIFVRKVTAEPPTSNGPIKKTTKPVERNSTLKGQIIEIRT